MSHWDWNRVAYVFFVLAVFSALVKIGGMTLADSGPISPRAANADPAITDREPPWYMGTFLELEDDRGFLGVPPAKQETLSEEIPSKPTGANKRETAGVSSEAPVFYRPSEGPGPVCGNLSSVSKDSRVVFPLVGAHSDSYSDTWGAVRPQGGHEGTDLMVPAGTPEYAVTDGTVVAVSGANENGWNTLGGYTVMIQANYTVGPIKAGDLFYYAHMEAPSELPIGSRVRAGQVVGRAGDTGQGPEVTTGLFPAHLHLGWYDGSGGRTEVESGAMNPYPLLEWLKGNGGSVTGGSDASYCEAPQTDGPRPSTGEDAWPTPADPGERPDLDTGSDHARPSPVVKRSPDPRDEVREETPEEPREVHLGTPGTDPGADEEDRDFIGEIPDDEPDDATGDLPDIVDDDRGSDPAGGSSRWRDRIRDVISDLFPDRAVRGDPHPGDGKGEEDDRKDRNDRPRNDDPPKENPSDEDKGDDPPEEDKTGGGASNGENPDSDDARMEDGEGDEEKPGDPSNSADDEGQEAPAQEEGDGTAPPSGK